MTSCGVSLFLAHLSEPLIRRVGVWKQLRLTQWFATTQHKTLWKRSFGSDTIKEHEMMRDR
jgi:hypothetical protein